MKILPIAAAAVLAAFTLPGSASANTVAPAPAPMVALSGSLLASADMGQNWRERREYQRHHARRSYWRRTCVTRWRHGRRIRDCRRVRYWR